MPPATLSVVSFFIAAGKASTSNVISTHSDLSWGWSYYSSPEWHHVHAYFARSPVFSYQFTFAWCWWVSLNSFMVPMLNNPETEKRCQPDEMFTRFLRHSAAPAVSGWQKGMVLSSECCMLRTVSGWCRWSMHANTCVIHQHIELFNGGDCGHQCQLLTEYIEVCVAETSRLNACCPVFYFHSFALGNLSCCWLGKRHVKIFVYGEDHVFSQATACQSVLVLLCFHFF